MMGKISMLLMCPPPQGVGNNALQWFPSPDLIGQEDVFLNPPVHYGSIYSLPQRGLLEGDK